MEKIKYGLLGTANIARRQTIGGMNCVSNSEFYAVAGRNPQKVDEFVKDFGFAKGYYSYDELLDDPEIQVVYVALPNSLHCEWAIKAMKKGKHVLCEKPMGCTLAEVKEMYKTAKECGVLLMEAFAYLHNNVVASFKEVINSGKIGKPVLLESTFITPKAPDTNVRRHRTLMGGSIYDLGCYPTSLALYLFDEMPTEAKCSAHFTEKNIDDLNGILLHYEDGKNAIITVGMCSARVTTRINIYCEKGAIYYSGNFNSVGDVEYILDGENGKEIVKLEVPNNYGLEIERFTNAITKGESMLVDEKFTMQNAEILDMLLDDCGYNQLG
ncbi:MAG: Gfo/Idh/MocA family oxidoreductase [Bacillota bacterium]